MKRRVISKAAVKRAAVRSARASSKLERRVVPATFVREARVERFLAERRQRG